MACSVVIPCLDRSDLTRLCVQSLLGQTCPPSEILLVDNASRDDTANLGHLSSLVRVVRLATNRGFAGGVNVGLSLAQHEHVLVLNNDTQAAPNLLAELRASLDSDPAIAAAAPVSNHVKGHACIEVQGDSRSAPERERIAASLANAPRLQDVTTLSGLCLWMRRAWLDKVGLFDERFGTGNFEDDDLSLRMRLHGARLVLARRAFLHHEGHATFRNLGLDMAQEIAEKRRRFAVKWREQSAGRAVLASMDGQTQIAGELAGLALCEWPAWMDAHWHLGTAAAERGDATAAAGHFRALLRECPRHIDAMLALGNALLRAGEVEAGLSLLHGLADEPRIPLQEAYRLETLGRHCLATHQPEAATHHLQAALQIAPDSAGTLHNLLGACWLQLGHPESAEPLFAAAAALGNPEGHGNLGICRFRRGDHTGARASFRIATELAPHDGALRRNYELACENAGA